MPLDTVKVVHIISKTVSTLPAHKSFENYFNQSLAWWIIYAFVVGLITLLLRLLFSAMRALEEKVRIITPRWESVELFTKETALKAKSFKERVKIIFKGCSEQDPTPDLWYNTFIGTFELSLFPFILKAEQYTFIGAWLGYKVVANWSVWNKNRLKFNSFLIGNLIVVSVSYVLKIIFL